MLKCLTAQHWPVVTVLSDHRVTKAFNASTFDLKDQQWKLIAETVPVLKQLKKSKDSSVSWVNHGMHCCLPNFVWTARVPADCQGDVQGDTEYIQGYCNLAN